MAKKLYNAALVRRFEIILLSLLASILLKTFHRDYYLSASLIFKELTHSRHYVKDQLPDNITRCLNENTNSDSFNLFVCYKNENCRKPFKK